MNKKKNKVIILILLLIILILICKKVLTFDSINYKINVGDTKLKIKEVLSQQNYYMEIKSDSKIYPFRVYYDLSNKRKIIDKIYFYKDKNIECILPVINKKHIQICYVIKKI